jgi:hypothetical protein
VIVQDIKLSPCEKKLAIRFVDHHSHVKTIIRDQGNSMKFLNEYQSNNTIVWEDFWKDEQFIRTDIYGHCTIYPSVENIDIITSNSPYNFICKMDYLQKRGVGYIFTFPNSLYIFHQDLKTKYLGNIADSSEYIFPEIVKSNCQDQGPLCFLIKFARGNGIFYYKILINEKNLDSCNMIESKLLIKDTDDSLLDFEFLNYKRGVFLYKDRIEFRSLNDHHQKIFHFERGKFSKLIRDSDKIFLMHAREERLEPISLKL